MSTRRLPKVCPYCRRCMRYVKELDAYACPAHPNGQPSQERELLNTKNLNGNGDLIDKIIQRLDALAASRAEELLPAVNYSGVDIADALGLIRARAALLKLSTLTDDSIFLKGINILLTVVTVAVSQQLQSRKALRRGGVGPKKEAEHWIARIDQGDISDAERRELQSWLLADPQNERDFIEAGNSTQDTGPKRTH